MQSEMAKLQQQAEQALRDMVYLGGYDAVKVLTLKMVAKGGNSRVAVEVIAAHYKKLHAMEANGSEMLAGIKV